MQVPVEDLLSYTVKPLSILILLICGFSQACHVISWNERQRNRKTHAIMGLNWLILEQERRTRKRFPLPGYIGPAKRIVSHLQQHSSDFRTCDAWGKPLLYVCNEDADQYILVSYGGSSEVGIEIQFSEYSGEATSDLSGNVVISDAGAIQQYGGWSNVPFSPEISDDEIKERIRFLLRSLAGESTQ